MKKHLKFRLFISIIIILLVSLFYIENNKSNLSFQKSASFFENRKQNNPSDNVNYSEKNIYLR